MLDTPTAQFTVEMRAVISLRANPLNYNRHSPDQIDRLAESLRVHGQEKPIVIAEDGEIIAGHGLWEAARSLGWSQMACHVYHGQNAAAYLIADNFLATLAEPDPQLLANLLKDLQSQEQLAATGYEPAELDRLLAELQAANPAPIPEEGEIPEPQEGPTRVQPGEVWALGKHRVMCGDSTEAASVALLLGGGKPNLMVTDPPYGVEYDPAWRQEAAEKGLLAYAARRVGEVANDDRADWREAWAFFPGDVIYCWHAARHASEVQQGIEASGFEIRSQIIWAKPHFPISRGHYHWRHEPCWYAVRKGADASWIDGRDQTTLWEITLDRNVEGGHGTQKPLECMERPIRNHAGDVYDPFCGSGTTVIAAERHGRACYAMEVLPRYCDVILARWEKFTGKVAERVA